MKFPISGYVPQYFKPFIIFEGLKLAIHCDSRTVCKAHKAAVFGVSEADVFHIHVKIPLLYDLFSRYFDNKNPNIWRFWSWPMALHCKLNFVLSVKAMHSVKTHTCKKNARNCREKAKTVYNMVKSAVSERTGNKTLWVKIPISGCTPLRRIIN